MIKDKASFLSLLLDLKLTMFYIGNIENHQIETFYILNGQLKLKKKIQNLK